MIRKRRELIRPWVVGLELLGCGFAGHAWMGPNSKISSKTEMVAGAMFEGTLFLLGLILLRHTLRGQSEIGGHPYRVGVGWVLWLGTLLFAGFLVVDRLPS